jgi:hypothetical protein
MSPEAASPADPRPAAHDPLPPAQNYTLVSMRSCLLLLVTTGMLAASAAAAEPLGTKTDKPVTFWAKEGGVVDSGFHPRKDRNRVFYAASLKQDRGWMSFTSIPNNPDDYNFKKYALFAVFYKGHQGYSATVQSVQESPAGALSARVTVDCYNPSLCAAPPPELADFWGIYVVIQIDKRSLVRPPKTLYVTTVFTP